jgi:hypothetical protein
MFDDCIRLKDCKTHAKKFCLQCFNPLIYEKGVMLVYEFS